jgi:hypothetical protein
VTTSAVPEPESLSVPAPGAPSIPVRQQVCLDCGAVLLGKFCSVCGQKVEPLKRGLKDLAREFFQHPLIDTKLWRSLVPLLLRPGALTEEYLAGRRTRYVRPLKLYLTVSVVFFSLLALRPPKDNWVKFTPDSPPKAGSATKETLHLPIHWLDERWQRNMSALDGPEAAAAQHSVQSKVASSVPKLVFVLLPLSAVLLKLFWWRRYYVEHLVFTLHVHSFVFTTGLLRFLGSETLNGLVALLGAVYVALAVKRVYRDGWVKTLAKLLGVSLLYSLLLAAAFVVVALGAILTA